jgi:hypothetical protein
MSRKQVSAGSLLILAGLALAAPAFSHEGHDVEAHHAPSRFGPLAWLEGEWTGYGEFPDRTNYIHKTFEHDQAGMFMIERTLAVFPPEELSTDFEAHQDMVVYYLDEPTGTYRAKAFYVEGFVTSFGIDVNEDGSLIVLESTDVEGGPPGMRSRMTISRETDDRYVAVFEIAMPNRDYAVYEEITMERVE